MYSANCKMVTIKTMKPEITRTQNYRTGHEA